MKISSQKDFEEIFGHLDILEQKLDAISTDNSEIKQRIKTIELDNKKAIMLSNMVDKREADLKDRNKAIANALLELVDEVCVLVDSIKRDQKEEEQDNTRVFEKKLSSILSASGIEEIPAKIGDIFDPGIHSCEHIQCDDADTIKEIIKKGYRDLKTGDIIRYTKVILGGKEMNQNG